MFQFDKWRYVSSSTHLISLQEPRLLSLESNKSSILTSNNIDDFQSQISNRINQDYTMMLLQKGELSYGTCSHKQTFYDIPHITLSQIIDEKNSDIHIWQSQEPEVALFVDKEDRKLQNMLCMYIFWIIPEFSADCNAFCGMVCDLAMKIKMIALFVSNNMGGSSAPLETLNSLFKDQVKKSDTNIVSVGNIRFGTNRTKCILFKVIADYLDVPCKLQRITTHPEQVDYQVLVVINKTEFKVDWKNPTNLQKVSDNSPITQHKPRIELNKPHKWFPLINLPSSDVHKIQVLGKTGVSTVWRTCVGGFTVAMKEVNLGLLDPKSQSKLQDEVQVLQRCSHPNIVAYLGHQTKPATLQIFMEYVAGTLFDIIQEVASKKRADFSFQEVKVCSLSVLRALQYLHSQSPVILHKDIKSKNILVEIDEKGQVNTAKLCDFGSCVVLSQPTTPTVVTAKWSPPECIRPANGAVEDSKSDIWSFGMLLYEMLSLKIPFAEINYLDVKDHIVAGNVPSLSDITQPKLSEILVKCWSYETSLRPSAVDLIKFFEELHNTE